MSVGGAVVNTYLVVWQALTDYLSEISLNEMKKFAKVQIKFETVLQEVGDCKIGAAHLTRSLIWATYFLAYIV